MAYGAEWVDVNQMDIDPYDDLEKTGVQDPEQDKNLTILDDPVYEQDLDVGIMPMLDISELTWSLHMSGFGAYGTDTDGDSWSGPNVDSTISYPAMNYASAVMPDFSNIGWSGVLLDPVSNRPNKIINSVEPSIFPGWIGRQVILNGDPMVTLNTGYKWRAGTVFFDVTNWEEEKGVSSLQIIDGHWIFGLGYSYWTDPSQTSFLPVSQFNPSRTTGIKLESVHLYINGNDVGPITEYSSSYASYSNFINWFEVKIPDTVVTFDEQMVRSVSIGMNFSAVTWQGSDQSYEGGLGISLWCSRGQRRMCAPNIRFVSGVDPATENTGLLKSIIDFLRNIVNGITNIASAIAQLPGKIANLIIEGIKTLFIPSEEDFTNLKTQYETLLSERLGFVWQAGEWIVNFGQSVLSAITSGGPYSFVFPGVTVNLPEGTYEIIPETNVSLENGIMDVLRPALGTVVTLICVLAFINTAEGMVVAIVSGASYYEFLKGGKHGAD